MPLSVIPLFSSEFQIFCILVSNAYFCQNKNVCSQNSCFKKTSNMRLILNLGCGAMANFLICDTINGPMHEILVLIPSAGNKGSCKSAHNSLNLHCSHTQNMDVDESLDHNLDLASLGMSTCAFIRDIWAYAIRNEILCAC